MIKNSYLLWKGKSLFNGEMIAVVITGFTIPSSNPKTGPMLQSWIVPLDQKPTDAVRSGLDAAVCGDCPLRGGACYVNLATVNQVYQTIDRAEYIPPEAYKYVKLARLGLRIGSYGDPAMTPLSAWEMLLKVSAFHVGYTHQWGWCDPEWRNLLQASVETPGSREIARAAGWKTFRVKPKNAPIEAGETVCPNQTNSFVKCNQCRLCSGSKKDIVIDVHGAAFKINQFNKIQQYGNKEKSGLPAQEAVHHSD